MNIRLTPTEETVLEALRQNGHMTNSDIASYAFIPEPSVRRATRSLETKAQIHVTNDWRSGFSILVWAANTQVATR